MVAFQGSTPKCAKAVSMSSGVTSLPVPSP